MGHPKGGAPIVAAQRTTVPIVNGGDGGHVHPTQTLTDLLTIKRKKGRLSDMTIGKKGPTLDLIVTIALAVAGVWALCGITHIVDYGGFMPGKSVTSFLLTYGAVLFLPLTVGGTIECAKDAVMSTVTLETLSTGSWNAPIWPTKIVMTISLIILTLQGIAEIVGLIQRLRAMKGER